MGDDRILFNSLERVISTDFNDAQSMIARRADDILRYIGRDYRIPAATLPGSSPTYANWVSGLELSFTSATTVQVEPGVLAIEQPSNITQGPLDSPYRIGVLRAAASIEVPDVATDRYLVAARIVEVQVTEVSRDVRSPSTDTFVSNAVVKQIELQIELGVFTDGTSTYPPLSALGTEWEPLGFVLSTNIEDARREFRDVIQSGPSQVTGIGPNDTLGPYWIDRKLASAQATTQTDDAGGFKGNLLVKHKSRIYRLWNARDSSVSVFPLTNDGETILTGQLLHVYIVPLIDAATGNRRVLTSTMSSGNIIEGGILVQSNVVTPTEDGTNSAALSLPGNFTTNYGTIPIGDAIHVYSANLRNTGTTSVYRPWVVNGNEFRYQAMGQGNISFTIFAPSYGNFSAVAAMNANLLNVNLYGGLAGAPTITAGIPRNATHFEMSIDGSNSVAVEMTLTIVNNLASGTSLYRGPKIIFGANSNLYTGMIPLGGVPGNPDSPGDDVELTMSVNVNDTFMSQAVLEGYRY